MLRLQKRFGLQSQNLSPANQVPGFFAQHQASDRRAYVAGYLCFCRYELELIGSPTLVIIPILTRLRHRCVLLTYRHRVICAAAVFWCCCTGTGRPVWAAEAAGTNPANQWRTLTASDPYRSTKHTVYPQNWGITTALAFGFAIMYLVYTFGHISGGQVNCAVTLALVLSGHLGVVQGKECGTKATKTMPLATVSLHT